MVDGAMVGMRVHRAEACMDVQDRRVLSTSFIHYRVPMAVS
jgi:hypothetical protein